MNSVFLLHSGADIADYFNYGFTEDTWKLYCDKQRKMRGEINQLNKIVVSNSQSFFWVSSTLRYSSSNNLLVRIHSLIRILSLAVSICVIMMFMIIDDAKIDCTKCRIFADDVISNHSSILLFEYLRIYHV